MPYQRIAITGASSGIGENLALNFAKKGVHFYLNARNLQRLESIKEKLEKMGSSVEICAFDVSDENKMKEWIEHIFQTRLDLLILNAGISSGKEFTAQKELEVAKINALGVANGLFYAFFKMKQQELINQTRGQIVLLSSVASLLSLPNAPAYSASKHFVSSLGEAMALNDENITITTICPGFIKTPLTAHLKLKMMSVEFAAFKITKAIKAKKRTFIFPLKTAFLAKFYDILPFFAKKKFVSFLKNKTKM